MTLCNLCGCPVPHNRYGHTSTLCEDCLDGLREDHDDAIAEYRRERPNDDMDVHDPDEGTQGKRPDQVAYSGGVLIVGVVLLALLMAGLSIGAWVAYWTTPMP